MLHKIFLKSNRPIVQYTSTTLYYTTPHHTTPHHTTPLHYTTFHDNPTENNRQEKKVTKNVTNQRTIGLISADRSNKATLLLTIPRSKFKSSAKDLSSLIFEVIIQGRR